MTEFLNEITYGGLIALIIVFSLLLILLFAPNSDDGKFDDVTDF